MAGIQVEQNTPLAKAIQDAIQPRIVANGWVAEESDVTLAEYITMMLVNGQNEQQLVAELGQDLLGAEAGDERPAEFARFLFEQARALAEAEQRANAPQPTIPASVDQNGTVGEDDQMNDVTSDAPVEKAPTGPNSMRNNQRGRGGRLLGQMNRNMDRGSELPDSLRRIKGAAGGQSGRINAHSGTPRGPRQAGSGLQRMANGMGRGGGAAFGNNNNMANAAMQNNPMAAMNPQQQMQLMQMMELQTQLFQQLAQNGGQMPNFNNSGFQQNGGRRGGRGGAHKSQPKQAHAVNGRLPDGPLQTNGADSAMEVDGDSKDHFGTLCRFNLACTVPTCGYAHQSPAAPAGVTVDLTDTCSHGVACTNNKCSARHASPAQKNQQAKQEVDCKFYPNCTNPRCPFRHPAGLPICRNGADCTTPGCKFTHSTIMCRYNPCLNPNCTFKHNEGQRGKFSDKVWTANGGENGTKSERFSEFVKQGEGQEELIVPAGSSDAGIETAMQDSSAGVMTGDVVT